MMEDGCVVRVESVAMINSLVSATILCVKVKLKKLFCKIVGVMDFKYFLLS